MLRSTVTEWEYTMKVFYSGKIRNIAVGGHSGSGKTSLIEAFLFKAGLTDRLGSVQDGNTFCDYDPEEIKRKVSVTSTIAPTVWNDRKINFIDTPGLFDYEGSFIEGIKAADTVLVCASARSGIKVGTQKAFKAAKKAKKGCAVFITKMDTDNINFEKVIEDLVADFGPAVCPLVLPVMEGERVKSYINVVEGLEYTYDGKGNATSSPADTEIIERYMPQVREAVAETDDELMERFFADDTFTTEEIETGIRKGVAMGKVIPVFAGSALDLGGIDISLDAISKFIPPAYEYEGEPCIDSDGNEVRHQYEENGDPSLFVFKTIADPFVGKLSFFKVITGKLVADTRLINAKNGEEVKIGKLLLSKGKKQEDVTEIWAGDIGAVAKVGSIKTGDTLCTAGNIFNIVPIKYPKSCMTMGVKPKSKGDETKIASSIAKLIDEDPTLKYENNAETHQQTLSGMGEQHLDVAVSKLQTKFGVEVVLEKPIVPYRETIRKPVKVEGKHKKQTGGHGQFGHVWIEFEPCDSESLVFETRVVGGAVPKGFFPAVEKGLQDNAKHGPMAGYPVVGLKATLVDGSYHPVDSSEMSFKMAAGIAYREGLAKASPQLLEPVVTARVYLPEEYTGDIMGELTKRRGRVLGMEPDEDGLTLITAEVPKAEMYDFTTVIRQVTRGKGKFDMEFARYEALPQMYEEEVIAQAKALKKEQD